MLWFALLGYIISAFLVMSAWNFRRRGRKIAFWSLTIFGGLAALFSTALLAFIIDLFIHPLVW
jgi:hypothetical protein